MATDTSDKPNDQTLDPVGVPTISIADNEMAADFIRDKVARIYAEEPNAAEEAAEAAGTGRRSKHQQFMYELSSSGKDLVAIQTEWHNYYQSLPADEKHQVWHEFYAGQSAVIAQPQAPANTDAAQQLSQHKQPAAKAQKKKSIAKKPRKLPDVRNKQEIQAAIKDKVSAGGKLETKHHLQSLLFGLGMGAIVVIIFLFGFFNEVVIAPFVQPSRVAAATPLIVGNDTVAPTAQPEVIIPKINVQIPTVFNESSTQESVIENNLESGIVHYPTTALPGQTGNAAFFGHSSNNIFNKGKYKFAFVLLHTMVPGDTFYLTYNSKVYVYKVISKTVVDPSEVGVLGPVSGQSATATLITCDPPGTSLKRLVVVGQQISPDPTGNSQASASAAASSSPTSLPGNGQTLWGRFIKTILGKGVIIIFVIAAAVIIMRRANKILRPAL